MSKSKSLGTQRLANVLVSSSACRDVIAGTLAQVHWQVVRVDGRPVPEEHFAHAVDESGRIALAGEQNLNASAAVKVISRPVGRAWRNKVANLAPNAVISD